MRPRRSPRPFHAVAGTALLALLLLASGCASAKGNRTRQQRVSVTVATAMKSDVPYMIAATGTVEPVQSADVGARVGGVVTRVLFREGDEVRAGQALFQLDPRPLRAVLEQAQGTLARDKAQAELARLEAERAEKLHAQNVLSQAEWDQKRSAAAQWAATLRMGEATVSSARLNLGYAQVRAPIGGRTGRLMVHEGDLVQANAAAPLVTINQTRPVRVAFTVPVSEVPAVQQHRGGRPRVIARSANAGDSVAFEGPLVFVDNAVDPSSGTLLLKGEFPNADGRLVPGEFVDVRLRLFVEPQVTVVPALAVTRGQEGAYVYVMNADSTVTARPVTVSRTVDELAVLTAGVTPGETVVTDGQLRLSAGARVQVRSPERAEGGPRKGAAAAGGGRGGRTKAGTP